MSTTQTRTLADRAGAIIRQVNALVREPSEWDTADLVLLAQLDTAIARARDTAVLGLRECGYNDREIGEALGVTQQAVSKRWPGGGRYVGAAGRYRQTGGSS